MIKDGNTKQKCRDNTEQKYLDNTEQKYLDNWREKISKLKVYRPVFQERVIK